MGTLSTAGIGIKPLVSIRQHAKLTVATFAITLLLGLPMIWLKGQPKYETEAVIQIAPRYMKTLKDDNELDFQSNSQYRQFVQQQTSTVLREDILRDAIRKVASAPAVQRWQLPGENERQSIRRLRTSLLVLPVPDTYMVRISLSSSDPQPLAPIINAVTSIYLERARNEQVFGKDERTAQLQKRQQQLLRDIDDKAERRNQIAGELGIATFSEEAGNPYDKAIERLREALADARIKRFDAEAREKAFLQHGETDPAVRSILESVSVDPGLNSLKASLNNRRAQLVSGMAGLTEQHPGYQQSRQELGEIDQEISSQTGKLTQSVRSNLQSRFATATSQSRQLEQDIQAELTRQEQSRGRFATLFKEAQNLSAEIEQVRKELDSIGERLNFFTAETGSLGFVRLVTAAQVPDLPQGPGKKKIFLMVVLAALLAAIAVPVARDLLDRRIHAPNDVSASFGFPPLGWLIEADSEDSRSFRCDQLRRLASALIREQDRTGMHIFGLCALQPGGGASSLTLELQATFAQMGLPAIAVEANAFNRDPRFATAPELELADPQMPQAACASLRLAGSGRHLHAIDRLGACLQQLAQQYRFVLVDVPPLLASGDAELTLRATPGILAVIEAEAQGRGEVGRAARLLQGIDPDSIGVVVNRVRPLDGGGYVRDLMNEFLTGRKPPPANLLRELRLTGVLLIKGAGALLTDLRGQLPRRGAHHETD
ncbi:GumC family protein [Chitinilyticum piscinae]|uniref:Chain length determinant protein n=1 Tax=Chitinilyticum piscinae TaxID=2866724 RepID=A0A8J7KEH7_9NEIS|nr:hypothetical protein [Chitinilyticum piscinae]MBE9609549.1 hypothetical protein [Chitinilyticum piscinae]